MIVIASYPHYPGPGDLPGHRAEYWDDAPEVPPETPFTRNLAEIQAGMTVLEYGRRLNEAPEDMARLLTEFGVHP